MVGRLQGAETTISDWLSFDELQSDGTWLIIRDRGQEVEQRSGGPSPDRTDVDLGTSAPRHARRIVLELR